MKANKKKIIVIVSMVLLLVATGCLNYFLTVGTNAGQGNLDNSTPTATTPPAELDFFASYREDRELTRAQKILYLNEIISSEVSSQEAIVSAEDNRLQVIDMMDTELVLEGLIKASGFEDCIVSFGNDDIVNVVVKAAEISDIQMIQIVDIVVSGSNTAPGDVVVLAYI